MQFDVLFSSLKSFSEKGNYAQLLEFINTNQNSLLENVNSFENELEALDVSEHTIIFTEFLYFLFENRPHKIELINWFIHLIKEFNVRQMKHVMDHFINLCDKFTASLVYHNIAIRGILPISHAIRKIQKSETHLTAIHHLLCYLCLESKCLKPALRFLDVNITAVNDEPNEKIDVKNFLLYYYYGGTIYLTQGNLDRACYFFEIVVTTPANVLSLIMLEAYKKFLLASLLAYGKPQLSTKLNSPLTMANFKPVSKPYHDLLNVFNANSLENYVKAIQSNEQTFVRDQNLGLVNQTIKVFNCKNIQKLTKTFVTLNLSDVSSRLGISGADEVEEYLACMIKKGDISAYINKKDGMVVFKDDDDKYSGVDIMKTINEYISTCMDLSKQIVEIDQELLVNPVFVQKNLQILEDDQSLNVG